MIYITTLQGVQIGNPFSDPNTIYEIEGGVIIAPSPDTVIEIAPNCVLRFKGDIDTTAPLITLVGNNTYIEAGSYQIFRDKVNLGGSFTNAEWPAEWWGAKSDGTDAAPAINRALEQIANTDKQGTLLLADRYEVRDTIYMQPGVAISGVSSTFSYRLYPTKNNQGQIENRHVRGTLVVDLADSVIDNVLVHGYEKWVIDTKYEVGGVIPYNKLYISDSDSFEQRIYSEYTGCNISNLHIVDKPSNGTQSGVPANYFFGGIRIHSMQAATIRNVDIEAHVLIGLALVGKVWFTSIDNVYIRSYGCGLYLGRACTEVSSNNLGLHCWIENRLDEGNKHQKQEEFELPYRLALPGDYSGPLVAPELQPNSLPPYWDAEKMYSCGIIMENKAHCTFVGCTVEHFDAVICGTDYNAKFISPYIEDINYFFAWLYCSEPFSMPNKRYELIIEDLVHGFETFPSMKKANNNYQYLDWVDYDPLQQPNAGGSQPAQGAPAIDPEGDPEPVEVQRTVGYYRFLPTFGTVRGVIKAHNVGRATCWTNEDSIFEQDKDGNWHLVTWAYPSYFIYVTPGIRQRNFYYDKYKVMVEKMTVVGTNELLSEITWLEDMDYCRYKRIIIEGSPNEPVRYYYDETNDAVYDVTEDNKAEMDIYKRALQLGVSGSDVVLCGELFERGLDNFIMTPVYSRSQINYGGVVRWKRFCIEIIDAANVVQFVQPLKLHGCEVTFKNSRGGTAAFQKNGMPHLLEISGDCVLIFDGNFGLWNNDNTQTPPSFGKLITLVGDNHVKLSVRLINAPSLVSYFSQASNFITNSGSFIPGYDLVVESF